MLNGGVHYDGFGFRVDGVGMGTYQEIRRRLMSNGFPDLSHEVFGRGYDGTISTELALKYMLNRWPEATRKQRRALLKNWANIGATAVELFDKHISQSGKPLFFADKELACSIATHYI